MATDRDRETAACLIREAIGHLNQSCTLLARAASGAAREHHGDAEPEDQPGHATDFHGRPSVRTDQPAARQDFSSRAHRASTMVRLATTRPKATGSIAR